MNWDQDEDKQKKFYYNDCVYKQNMHEKYNIINIYMEGSQ